MGSDDTNVTDPMLAVQVRMTARNLEFSHAATLLLLRVHRAEVPINHEIIERVPTLVVHMILDKCYNMLGFSRGGLLCRRLRYQHSQQ